MAATGVVASVALSPRTRSRKAIMKAASQAGKGLEAAGYEFEVIGWRKSTKVYRLIQSHANEALEGRIGLELQPGLMAKVAVGVYVAAQRRQRFGTGQAVTELPQPTSDEEDEETAVQSFR